MPQLSPLRTTRLVLRPFEPCDVGWLAEMASDPEVKQLTLDEAVPAEKARSLAGYGLLIRMRRVQWAITLDGEPCGFICMTRTNELGPPGAYVGFELRRRFWRRGIATESLRAVVECAFDFFGLDAVLASVLQPNSASMRVLEKAGLRRGGEVMLPGERLAYWYVLGREETGRAMVTGWRRRWGYRWRGIRLWL